MTKPILVKLLLLAAVILVSLSVIEIFLRIYSPQLTLDEGKKLSPKVFEKSDYTPWKLKPNSSDRMTNIYNDFNINISINSIGLRDREIGKKARYRILVLGDSTTFGVGVELNQTWVKALESLLGNNSYELINGGRADGGYTTDIQYLYLKNKGFKLSPDMVMLAVFPINDFNDLNINNWVKNDSENLPLSITSNHEFVENNRIRYYYLTKDSFIKREGILIGNIKYFLTKNSHLYTLIKNTIIRAKFKPSKVHLINMGSNLNHNFEITKKLILKMEQLSGQHNSKFVVVLIPSGMQIYNHLWEEYKKFYPDEASRTMPEDLLDSFCTEHKLNCIALLHDFIKMNFTNNDIDFKHDGHWNERGNRIAAELIAPKIKGIAKRN